MLARRSHGLLRSAVKDHSANHASAVAQAANVGREFFASFQVSSWPGAFDRNKGLRKTAHERSVSNHERKERAITHTPYT